MAWAWAGALRDTERREPVFPRGASYGQPDDGPRCAQHGRGIQRGQALVTQPQSFEREAGAEVGPRLNPQGPHDLMLG